MEVHTCHLSTRKAEVGGALELIAQANQQGWLPSASVRDPASKIKVGSSQGRHLETTPSPPMHIHTHVHTHTQTCTHTCIREN